jgi:hypothetical protein
MTINDKPEKKNKSISFVSKEDHREDNISEATTLIGKKFNKTLNKLNTKWRTNVPDKVSNNSSRGKFRDEKNSDKGNGVRCFDCEGFGYIKTECPTYLKNMKKVMSIT